MSLRKEFLAGKTEICVFDWSDSRGKEGSDYVLSGTEYCAADKA